MPPPRLFASAGSGVRTEIFDSPHLPREGFLSASTMKTRPYTKYLVAIRSAKVQIPPSRSPSENDVFRPDRARRDIGVTQA